MIKHLININSCRLEATHSSILAWEIPWTEEPDGLLSMESQRVGHDLATNTHTQRKQNQDIVGRPTMGSCSVTKLCLTLWDLMDCCTPASCVLLCFPEFAQIHVHWCYPNILSSAALLSFCLQSFPASVSFPMSQLLASGGQSIGDSTSASVHPVNIQGWFPFRLTGLISLQSKELSGIFSSTIIWKHQFFGALALSPFFKLPRGHLTGVEMEGQKYGLTWPKFLTPNRAEPGLWTPWPFLGSWAGPGPCLLSVLLSELQYSPWSYAITDKCASTENEIKDVWVNYNPISPEN